MTLAIKINLILIKILLMLNLQILIKDIAMYLQIESHKNRKNWIKFKNCKNLSKEKINSSNRMCKILIFLMIHKWMTYQISKNKNKLIYKNQTHTIVKI